MADAGAERTDPSSPTVNVPCPTGNVARRVLRRVIDRFSKSLGETPPGYRLASKVVDVNQKYDYKSC
jgi:hypothetical protein